jgi:hypothetical protein
VKVTRRLVDRLGDRVGGAAQRLQRVEERVGQQIAQTAHAAPDAPGGRPRAAYSGILDGRHLWLAIEATPGTLALRDPGGGVVALTSDLAEDDPRYRSVRSDLSAVPTKGGGEEVFEVVITAPGGKVHRIWTPPLPRTEPMRVPDSAGVCWRLARSEDGTLELRRQAAPAGALLVSIDAGPDVTVTLRLTGAPEGAVVRLVDDDSGEEVPLGPVDGAVATITSAQIPEGVGRSFSVYAGDLPVRRARNDLGRPDNAVLLPQVQNPDPRAGEDTAVPMFSLVYRWLPDGVLRIRRPQGRAQERDQQRDQGRPPERAA